MMPRHNFDGHRRAVPVLPAATTTGTYNYWGLHSD